MYLGEKASWKQKTLLRLHKICIKIIKYQKTDYHHQHKIGEAGKTRPVQLEGDLDYYRTAFQQAEGNHQDWEPRHFTEVHGKRTRDNGYKLKQEK